MKIKVTGNDMIYRTIFFNTKKECLIRKPVEIAKLEKKGAIIVKTDITREIANFSWRLDIAYLPKGTYEIVDDSVEAGVYLK